MNIKLYINRSREILNQEGVFSFLIKSLFFIVLGRKGYKNRIRIFWIDSINKIHYGSSAPKYAERIWINSQDVKMAIPILGGRRSSGVVIKDNWPFKYAIPIYEVPKIRCCIEHWINNISWEETGVYDIVEDLINKKPGHDSCFNMNDIKNRYEKLDEIFDKIKIEGRLRTREEISPNSFREQGGVLIHVGPHGELFFSKGGHHRFAIAYILNLPIPAQIGCVHASALPYLDALRSEKECMNDRSDIHHSHLSS